MGGIRARSRGEKGGEVGGAGGKPAYGGLICMALSDAQRRVGTRTFYRRGRRTPRRIGLPRPFEERVDSRHGITYAICARRGGQKMTTSLQREFDYYLKHQNELVSKYKGKFIVIKDQQVIDVYDSELEAVLETGKKHDMGTFLVQKCEPGPDSYTHVFHSRVAFA